jgi:hypothetical protein
VFINGLDYGLLLGLDPLFASLAGSAPDNNILFLAFREAFAFHLDATAPRLLLR